MQQVEGKNIVASSCICPVVVSENIETTEKLKCQLLQEIATEPSRFCFKTVVANF